MGTPQKFSDTPEEVSEPPQSFSEWRVQHPGQWWAMVASAWIALVVVALAVGYALAGLVNNPALTGFKSFITWLLAANTNQVTWYVTRAAGLIGYLLLWLSTVWGLAVSSRILEGKLHGAYTYDFHQFISLLALGFIALHLVMLLLDQYLPFSVPQLLVPFLATYRPVWVAFGIFSLYITLLVTVTFYLRNRIGQKTFRTIHVFSLLGFLGAAVHGLVAGTDGPLAIVTLMYALTVLSVVFMTVYWAALMFQKRALRKAENQPTHPLNARSQSHMKTRA